jgi:hypothetical protein
LGGAAEILIESLQEEKLTRDLLVELAEEIANPEAAESPAQAIQLGRP